MTGWMTWVFLLLALLTAYAFVRGVATGVVHSRAHSFKRDEQPFVYALGLAASALSTVFFVALASGYEVSEILAWAGLPDAFIAFLMA